jgi:hypothetical protein
MRIIAPLIAIAVLPACAATTSGTSPVANAGAGKCSVEALQSYVGQKVSADIGAELLAKSGARTLRWGPPRTAMTMDYREDRLNIAYDDSMVIERINCG